MTDTSIRVTTETRKRINLYKSLFDISQNEAIQQALDEAGAPTLPDDKTETVTCAVCGDDIAGDVMIPEGNSPMHTECWTDWMEDQQQ